jgi:hypothetical protein
MAAAIAPFAADLVALESSVDRAGRALGCTYATSEEFEAAFVGRHALRMTCKAAVQNAAAVISAVARAPRVTASGISRLACSGE